MGSVIFTFTLHLHFPEDAEQTANESNTEFAEKRTVSRNCRI